MLNLNALFSNPRKYSSKSKRLFLGMGLALLKAESKLKINIYEK
jgi:hypothetical protein